MNRQASGPGPFFQNLFTKSPLKEMTIKKKQLINYMTGSNEIAYELYGSNKTDYKLYGSNNQYYQHCQQLFLVLF